MQDWMYKASRAFNALVLTVLAACGGGGGGGSDSAAPASETSSGSGVDSDAVASGGLPGTPGAFTPVPTTSPSPPQPVAGPTAETPPPQRVDVVSAPVPSSTPLPAPAALGGSESPDSTTVLAGSPAVIIDFRGNTWGISSAGQIVVNGQVDTRTEKVELLHYQNNTQGKAMWQQANDLHHWWQFDYSSDAWIYKAAAGYGDGTQVPSPAKPGAADVRKAMLDLVAQIKGSTSVQCSAYRYGYTPPMQLSVDDDVIQRDTLQYRLANMIWASMRSERSEPGRTYPAGYLVEVAFTVGKAQFRFNDSGALAYYIDPNGTGCWPAVPNTEWGSHFQHRAYVESISPSLPVTLPPTTLECTFVPGSGAPVSGRYDVDVIARQTRFVNKLGTVANTTGPAWDLPYEYRAVRLGPGDMVVQTWERTLNGAVAYGAALSLTAAGELTGAINQPSGNPNGSEVLKCGALQ